MKVVINACYGGFDISHDAVIQYWEMKGEPIYFDSIDKWVTHYCTEDVDMTDDKAMNECYWSSRDIERTDPILIKIIEKMKEKANGDCANLKIVEVPDDMEWQIEEYDGFEHVAEVHRTWG